MEPNETLDELMAEGREWLEAGDRARAHTFFVTATQLYPGEEDAWRLRAETAADSTEAAQCYERIVALDPANAQAREELLDKRLRTLQQGALAAPSPKPALLSSGCRRAILVTGLGFLIVALGVIVVFGLLRPALLRENAVAGMGPIDIPPLNLPPTWTPIPTRTPTSTPVLAQMPNAPPATPVSGWATTTDLNVRAGPGVGYRILGVLQEGTNVAPVGRISDGSWLQIDYPEGRRLAWVARDYISISNGQVAALPVISGIPVASKPTALPPTATPAPRLDFILGRPLEPSADCSKPWRVLGTIYDSQTGSRRLNGVLVRVWAFSQLQGTVTSGSSDPQRAGYWEWSFNRGWDVVGQVAVVNPDGTLRSDPVDFQLTGKCDGAGAANQVILDFVGR